MPRSRKSIRANLDADGNPTLNAQSEIFDTFEFRFDRAERVDTGALLRNRDVCTTSSIDEWDKNRRYFPLLDDVGCSQSASHDFIYIYIETEKSPDCSF